MTSRATQTVQDTLAESLRGAARAFAPGDQVAPCTVLWLDPERLWEPVIPALRATIPELFVLGPYAAVDRTGPALWLRCVEARTVADAPPEGTNPIFYLPGVSRERLKDLESISSDLAPLAEIQFRGIVWLHPNGKEWTPLAFLLIGDAASFVSWCYSPHPRPPPAARRCSSVLRPESSTDTLHHLRSRRLCLIRCQVRQVARVRHLPASPTLHRLMVRGRACRAISRSSCQAPAPMQPGPWSPRASECW